MKRPRNNQKKLGNDGNGESRKRQRRATFTKVAAVWKNPSALASSIDSKVIFGNLTPTADSEPSVPNLIKCLGEKLPFECLENVRAHCEQQGISTNGVYMAHDSFGVPRYGGRGNIFVRLKKRKEKHPSELCYFSFYIIADKNHEKEIENLILRAAGHQMLLNTKKVRSNAQPGSVSDYEPGTSFYRRWPVR